MAELADAGDSKSSARKGVRVRLPPPAGTKEHAGEGGCCSDSPGGAGSDGAYAGQTPRPLLLPERWGSGSGASQVRKGQALLPQLLRPAEGQKKGSHPSGGRGRHRREGLCEGFLSGGVPLCKVPLLLRPREGSGAEAGTGSPPPFEETPYKGVRREVLQNHPRRSRTPADLLSGLPHAHLL